MLGTARKVAFRIYACADAFNLVKELKHTLQVAKDQNVVQKALATQMKAPTTEKMHVHNKPKPANPLQTVHETVDHEPKNKTNVLGPSATSTQQRKQICNVTNVTEQARMPPPQKDNKVISTSPSPGKVTTSSDDENTTNNVSCMHNVKYSHQFYTQLCNNCF